MQKQQYDFDQLLEMVAVGFQNENSFSTNPQDMHESVLHVMQNIQIFVNTFIYPFNQEVIESWRKWIVCIPKEYDIDW
jgi:hypothetical protein